MTGRTVAVIRQAAAVALSYPDTDIRGRFDTAAAAVAALPPGSARDHLARFLAHATCTDAAALARHYVETFDFRRRHTLHLTYYLDGDTRRRGMSLVRLTEIYAACGWRLDAAELPDHLSVVLEFAARGDAEWGRRLLTEFRPGLELLRTALTESGSDYADVLAAVCETLPAAGKAVHRRVRELVMHGPPTESVGLGGYGGPTLLGMPGRAPVPERAGS